jgi:hypothetical protein
MLQNIDCSSLHVLIDGALARHDPHPSAERVPL